MLPVLIYEPDERLRSRISDGLFAVEQRRPPALRMSVSTASLDGMRRAAEAETGIVLAVIGVAEGRAHACAELGANIMSRSRDSYTVFFMHDPTDLGALLENCMRPAGILTAPLSEKALNACVARILADYSALTGDEPEDCLIIDSRSASYRIPYSEITYLEALDKLLTIHTTRQAVTVRASLGALIESLPADRFLRCHRSYVVNARCIDQIDFPNMTLTLRSGEGLPVSRGQRALLREYVEQSKGGAK